MIQTPPRTILEVFESLPEGTLCQLIHNQLVMSPSPQPDHQRILKKIFRQLDHFVEKNRLGEAFFAPLDVYFDHQNVLQPDIFFISNERLHIIQDKIKGAPDLIIEIASASTEKYDKNDKKKIYERYGVKEYWIVEPKTKNAVGFQRTGNQFIQIAVTQAAIPSVLLGITINF